MTYGDQGREGRGDGGWPPQRTLPPLALDEVNLDL